MTVKSLLLAALLAAAPAIAQPAPPAPPAAPAPMGGPHGRGMHMGDRMFPSMSEAGRAIMREAMMTGGNRREDRQKMEAVRDKMLTVVSADKLDLAAIRRVMEEERALADASRQQRQSAMLAAIQKLSPEDRKAFVADSRAMKTRMEARMDGWRERWRQRRGGEPRPLPAPNAQPMEG
jgi:Spy/CpxP family protein refolding chaperone